MNEPSYERAMMFSSKNFIQQFTALAILLVSVMITSVVLAEEPFTNPTNRLITPKNDQSEEQQLSDQLECYNWTCETLNWDPYQAYDELAQQGYAVALDREEMERGLVCLAARGAVAGAVAGEVVGRPRSGAAIGAAIGVASGFIHSSYLLDEDDPQAQRIITRFERDLRKWETKFSGCMSRNGYRVHTD